MKNVRFYLLLLLGLLLVAGVAVYSNDRKVSVSKPKDGKLRIVSLAPSITEMLFMLGMGDNIVAATDFCNYPQQARSIPKIGGLGAPNIERLLACKPDLVLATNFELKDVPSNLRKLGIRVEQLKIDNFEELFTSFKKLGEIVGRQQQAEAVVADLQSQLDEVAVQFKDIPTDRRPKVYVEIWYDPVTTAGRSSYLNEVIEHAGGVNVVAELEQAYPIINPEKVIQWNPDVIISCYMDGRTGPPNGQCQDRIGWEKINAVRNKKVITDMPQDLILRPGPRLVEGVKELAKRIK